MDLVKACLDVILPEAQSIYVCCQLFKFGTLELVYILHKFAHLIGLDLVYALIELYKVLLGVFLVVLLVPELASELLNALLVELCDIPAKVIDFLAVQFPAPAADLFKGILGECLGILLVGELLLCLIELIERHSGDILHDAVYLRLQKCIRTLLCPGQILLADLCGILSAFKHLHDLIKSSLVHSGYSLALLDEFAVLYLCHAGIELGNILVRDRLPELAVGDDLPQFLHLRLVSGCDGAEYLLCFLFFDLQRPLGYLLLEGSLERRTALDIAELLHYLVKT